MTLLETSPERWVRKYLKGEDVDFSNKAMVFGSKLASHLEEETDDLEMAVIAGVLPRLDCVEMALNHDFQTEYGVIPLIAKPDTCQSDLSCFREVKTGKIPWTQDRANKHGQLHFYATLMHLKTNKIPSAWLDWVQTQEIDGVVYYTGKFTPFEVKLTMLDILKMRSRIIKNARKIDELVRQSIKEL